MATLNKFARNSNSPSPIYGIRPGFNVGDFEPRTLPKSVIATGSITATGTTVSLGARAAKFTVHVTAGSGTVTLVVKSNSDSYTATIATYGPLSLGNYDFFLGGWASPTGGTAYQATQYGPSGAQSQATSGLNPATDNNYVGGPYNPVKFLSLDGYDLQVVATVSGTVTYDIEIVPIS